MESLDINSFTASKPAFTFSMALKQAESGLFVAIKLTQSLSNQKYFIHVDQQKMDNIQGLTKYLETPSQLYDELKEVFNEITIDQSAAISFEVKIGKTKHKKITLQSSLKQQNYKLCFVQQLKQEMKSLKKSFCSQLQKMKLKQELLMKKLKQIQSVKELTTEVIKQTCENEQHLKQNLDEKVVQKSNFDQALSVLSCDINQLKYQNQQLKMQLSDVVKQLKQANIQIQQLQDAKLCKDDLQEEINLECEEKLDDKIIYEQKETEASYENESISKQALVPVKEPFRQANHLIYIDRVKGCKQHQFNKYFMINRISNNIFRLWKRSSSNTYTSFIHAFRAYPKQKLIIKMSIVYSQRNEIMLGICTNSLLGWSDVHLHPDSVSFDFRDSSVICYEYLVRKSNYIVEKGQLVEMLVDLVNWRITWRLYFSQNESKIIQELQNLPQRLRNRILFLHISMRSNQDFVDIVTA